MDNVIQMIDRHINQLREARNILAHKEEVAIDPTQPKRIISAAARTRMAAAQKARWKKYRATKKSA